MNRTWPLLFVAFALGCQKEYDAPVPDTTWDLFESSRTRPVDARAQQRMTGVYAVSDGAGLFGDEVVLQWTWTRDGIDTSYHVSIFSGRDIGYMTGSGRYLDSTMLLNMYWRTLANTGTGLCRLTITAGDGVQQLWGGGTIGPGSVVVHGVYGTEGDVPDRPITLTWLRPLRQQDRFQVLGHRCGGRNSDLLPVSENSVEMIRMASQLGCNGVEMDVRLTSDGVPVIYHDETLNVRCIQECGLFGPLEDYSYAQLSGIVRLIHGERIPTLREALDAVVFHTPLETVWLDTKNSGSSMQVVRDIQAYYMNAAAAEGRTVRILIGLPEADQVNSFLDLPDHADIPSLCELSIDDVHRTNSEVWAPRWTLGLQPAEVAQMHGEGRKVYVWTLDVPDYIHQYLSEGDFDGILSNYPSLVAFDDRSRP